MKVFFYLDGDAAAVFQAVTRTYVDVVSARLLGLRFIAST